MTQIFLETCIGLAPPLCPSPEHWMTLPLRSRPPVSLCVCIRIPHVILGAGHPTTCIVHFAVDIGSFLQQFLDFCQPGPSSQFGILVNNALAAYNSLIVVAGSGPATPPGTGMHISWVSKDTYSEYSGNFEPILFGQVPPIIQDVPNYFTFLQTYYTSATPTANAGSVCGGDLEPDRPPESAEELLIDPEVMYALAPIPILEVSKTIAHTFLFDIVFRKMGPRRFSRKLPGLLTLSLWSMALTLLMFWEMTASSVVSAKAFRNGGNAVVLSRTTRRRHCPTVVILGIIFPRHRHRIAVSKKEITLTCMAVISKLFMTGQTFEPIGMAISSGWDMKLKDRPSTNQFMVSHIL